MPTLQAYAQKQQINPVQYAPVNKPMVTLPALPGPFGDILQGNPFYNPSANVPAAPPVYNLQPLLDAPPIRGSFNPFVSSPLGSAPVPQSKPLLTLEPLLFKKDPDPYVDELIELRGPDMASGTSENGDLLTWALLLGGLGALYYYSKKKGKK